MNNYELMVIFTPVLSEDDFKSAQKKYQDFIKENGGDTVASNPWGLKSLAYPIDKKTTGIYWVLEFTGPATRLYRDWETDRKSTRLNSSH